MIGLPVALLTAGLILGATATLSAAEAIPGAVGAAQAAVSYYPGASVVQDPLGNAASIEGSDGQGIDGEPVATAARRIGAMTAARRVLPIHDVGGRAVVGDRRIQVTSVATDGASPLLRGKAELLSGRWPTAAGEVLVTLQGVRLGLPTSGEFSFARDRAEPTSYRVVGTGSFTVSFGRLTQAPAHLVFAPPTTIAAQSPPVWLVDRDTPITWPEVRRLNDTGLLVVSKAVLSTPPDAAELDAQTQALVSSDERDMFVLLAIIAVGLFVEATLLAGPAFAVSAARSRRTLALTASNGATRHQVRRMVLGQAVVLGAVSAGFGLLLGATAAWLIDRWTRASSTYSEPGPWEIPAGPIVAVLLCAFAACVVAAVIPARGLVRLDLVSALRGSGSVDRTRRGLPILGLGCMIFGAALSIGGTFAYLASRLNATLVAVAVGIGGLALVFGGLMVLPGLLAGASRLAVNAPLAIRMATRDASRQRARTVSATAAIMAAAAAMSALALAVESDAVQGQRDHRSQVPLGTGYVQGGADPTYRRVSEQITQLVPGLHQIVLQSLTMWPATVDASDPSGQPATLVSALRAGCTPRQALLPTDEDTLTRCASLGSLGNVSGQGIEILGAADIVRRLGLTGGDARRVRDGALVFAGPVPDSTAQVDLGGTTRAPTIAFAMAHGRAEGDGPLTLTDKPVIVELPVVTVARSALGNVFDDPNSAALVPSETADRLAWTTAPLAVLLEAPDRAISAEEQQRLAEGLDDDVYLVVERGYVRGDGVLILIALSIVTLLILVATLSATALSQAEAAPYLGTLAAVGATKRTRRALAAAQAATTAAIGSLVGVVLGLAPGVAIAIPLTSGSDGLGNPTAPVVVVPWLTMGALFVAVPTIAAALAWVAIRRSPVVTRRST